MSHGTQPGQTHPPADSPPAGTLRIGQAPLWADTLPGQTPPGQTPHWADTPQGWHPQAGTHPWADTSPIWSMSGRCTSYWNAFLLLHAILPDLVDVTDLKVSFHSLLSEMSYILINSSKCGSFKTTIRSNCKIWILKYCIIYLSHLIDLADLLIS